MFKSRKISQPTMYEDVTSGMKQVYKECLLPLEKEYKFHDFHSPMLMDPDFDGKPLVMLVGQFSTGKTTFIRWVWTCRDILPAVIDMKGQDQLSFEFS